MKKKIIQEQNNLKSVLLNKIQSESGGKINDVHKNVTTKSFLFWRGRMFIQNNS